MFQELSTRSKVTKGGRSVKSFPNTTKANVCDFYYSGPALEFRAEGGGEATRPGTEKRCSHNLQSDPLGSGFKKGRGNFPL